MGEAKRRKLRGEYPKIDGDRPARSRKPGRRCWYMRDASHYGPGRVIARDGRMYRVGTRGELRRVRKERED